jgi:hypothetical protein
LLSIYAGYGLSTDQVWIASCIIIRGAIAVFTGLAFIAVFVAGARLFFIFIIHADASFTEFACGTFVVIGAA